VVSARILSSTLAILVTVVVPILPALAANDGITKINHVVVIYQENRSFDSLYGNFPGANGLAQAGDAVKQVDKNGQPYAALPARIDGRLKPPGPDPRIPANLPDAPFDLSKYIKPAGITGDMVHRFYQEQYQIDGGKMDKFVAWSDAGLTPLPATLPLAGGDAPSGNEEAPSGRLFGGHETG